MYHFRVNMKDKRPLNYIEELNKEEGLYEVRGGIPDIFARSQFETGMFALTAIQINCQHRNDPENIRPLCIVWYPYIGIIDRSVWGYLYTDSPKIYVPKQETYNPVAYQLKLLREGEELPKRPKRALKSIANTVFQWFVSAYQDQGYQIIEPASLLKTLNIEAGGDVLYCGWCGKEIHAGNEHRKAKLFYCPGTNCKSKAHSFDKSFPKFREKWQEYNELKESEPDKANKLKQASPYGHLFDVAPDVVSAAESEWKALRPKEEPTPNGKIRLSRSPVNYKLGFSRAEIIRMLWPVCPNCGKQIPDSHLSLVRRYCENDKCKDEYNNKLKKRV